MAADRVAGAEGDEFEELHTRLHRIAAVLRRSGVAAAFRAACIEGGVEARLLRQPGGERLLTDLNHIAQLLAAESLTSHLGLPRLRAWLARRMSEAQVGDDAEDRSRRLDTDAQAVQILTIYRAKGLEFPVVYCPYLWDGHERHTIGEPIVFHDASDGDRRKVDVGFEAKADQTEAYKGHFAAEKEESRGEDLRLLYVALTRAKHQAVFWWAGADQSQQSALSRLLFDRADDGAVAAAARFSGVPTDDKVADRLGQLAAAAPGRFAVEWARGGTRTRWNAPAQTAGDLERATFDRDVDVTWRRSSYSAVVAAAYEAARSRGATVGSEPEESGVTDEPFTPTLALAVVGHGHSPMEARDDTPCPLGGLPAGADVGTVLHGVLERTDFRASDLETELAQALASETARRGAVVGDPHAVVAGLAAALRTPLGPLLDDLRLCDLGRADRLDELGFELPVAGGDQPVGSVAVSELAAVVGRHETPDDPLTGYAARLSDPLLERQLRGYLTGSLDLVLRVGTGRDARYLVADYKSNRLAAPGEPLVLGHYRHDLLGDEMQRHHYPLQALFYTVALHRYLRWRLAEYDPRTHLGGTLYLFLRGMAGPDTPRSAGTPYGVFGWRFRPELVTEVSDLLDVGAIGMLSAS
jgi:exodeoxyribonuclease V beta subunit